MLLVGGGLTGVLLPALAARWTGAALGPSARAGVAALAVVVALALDALGVRAPAVGRQVPQAFGHRHGPWAAAARYAPRLGLGPATILRSWLWWAGLAVGMSGGAVAAVAFGVPYVAVRSVMAVAIGSGVRDGTAMAMRMRTVAAWQHDADRITRAVAVVTAAGITAVAISALVMR